MIENSDFVNFMQATLMLWHGGIPYGRVEFFAAPWTSLLFMPFTFSYGLHLWRFASLLAVGFAVLLAYPRQYWLILLTLISFPTLYCILTGQVSAIVGLACLILLLETAGSKRVWVLIGCLFVASAKISLAAVPVAISMYFLLRERQGKSLLVILAFFGLLVGLYEFLYPNITMAWAQAILSGEYHRPPGLVRIQMAIGQIEFPLREYSSMPLIVSLPVLTLWMGRLKKGLSQTNIAIALVIGFLFLPYWRLYDLVMFAYPVGHIFHCLFGSMEEIKNVEIQTTRSLPA